MSPAEVERLRKTLRTVDNRVVLPDSLRGSALLSKLDGIEPDVPTKKKVHELVFPRRNRIRFLVGYAAAFMLVVGLFYNLGVNRPANLQGGEFVIDGPAAELAPLEHGGGVSPAGATRAGIPTGEMTINPEMATHLGEFGQYLLYHYPNPDRASDSPYLLLLLDADGQTVVLKAGLPPEMSEVSGFSIEGDDVVVLENSAGQQRFFYSVDFSGL